MGTWYALINAHDTTLRFIPAPPDWSEQRRFRTAGYLKEYQSPLLWWQSVPACKVWWIHHQQGKGHNRKIKDTSLWKYLQNGQFCRLNISKFLYWFRFQVLIWNVVISKSQIYAGEIFFTLSNHGTSKVVSGQETLRLSWCNFWDSHANQTYDYLVFWGNFI